MWSPAQSDWTRPQTRASFCGARAGLVVLGLAAVSCNALLGLNDVRPLASDSGIPETGGGGGKGGFGGVFGNGGSGAGGGSDGRGGSDGSGGRGRGTGGASSGGSGAGTGGASVAGTGGSAAGGWGGGPTGAGGRGGTGGPAGSGGAGGASSCGRELLQNGHFESGEMGWYSTPHGSTIIRRDDNDVSVAGHDLVVPQSPRYLARLGGPSAFLVTWIDQNFDMPADALEVTISGFILIQTDENPDDVYDNASVQLTTEAEATIFHTTPPWTNLTSAATWTPFSERVNVAPYAGTLVTFRLRAELDDITASYFFFDTVSLTVTGCKP